MSGKEDYYFVPVAGHWRMKRVGGTKVLRTFSSKAEAIAYAQTLIAKQQASFRLENPDGTWENL